MKEVKRGVQSGTKRGPYKTKGKQTATISFEADLVVKEWYDSLPEKKSEIIRNIIKKHLTV